MNSSDYNNFLSAIKTANAAQDKPTLAKLKSRLIAEYGLQDKEADYLIRQIRYNV